MSLLFISKDIHCITRLATCFSKKKVFQFEPDLLRLLLRLLGDSVPDFAAGDLDLDPALEPDRERDLERETLRDFAEPGDREDFRDPTDSLDLGDLDRERDLRLDPTDAAFE